MKFESDRMNAYLSGSYSPITQRDRAAITSASFMLQYYALPAKVSWQQDYAHYVYLRVWNTEKRQSADFLGLPANFPELVREYL